MRYLSATPSLIINLSRQGLLYIPAMLLLEAVLGINGLIWAQPVVDVLSMLLAVVLFSPFTAKCPELWDEYKTGG